MPIRQSSYRIRPIELLEARTLLAGDIVINEFMASNGGWIRDFENDSSDWIELHNTGTESVDISGWYLTDDAEAPRQMENPQCDNGGGGYLLVFASGKDLQTGPKLHTNFKLQAVGEYLASLADFLLLSTNFGFDADLQ